jgi:hypothetical protein
METTTTKTIDGLTVTVKVTKKVSSKTAYADGWNVDLGKETYENTTITIEKDGKKAFCDDMNFFHVVDDRYNSIRKQHPQAYARFGDTYISEKVYNTIKEVKDEAEAACQEDVEFVEIKATEERKKEEQEKEMEKIETMERERQNHPGWCNKCHSYCYGDCEA